MIDTKNIDMELVKKLEDKAVEIRKNLCTFIYRIGTAGHLGGELSLTDMAVALYYKYMNYDPKNPKWEERDRLILSKGHCAETLYTIYADLGMYTMDYLVDHFETLETAVFSMHPNRKYVDAIEASTGSLGHGLSLATGLALGARMSKANWRTFCIVGDGELQEGSNWEALMAAGHYKLGNLVVIVDKNDLQMSGTTSETISIDPLDDKMRAFGFDVIEIQGNDMVEVCAALDSLPPADPVTPKRPICIISNTTKGAGVSFMENVVAWHAGSLNKAKWEEALESIENNRRVR
ncbi:transketolase [Ferviditalea candida]|uniref:Transketolase n=1 Tax=Ferviditalea candida TaxID=3108399 RepID=A0ABU5ZDI3_9BACL|nr:transketolase [Paenibacillaceae bacterium T2]